MSSINADNGVVSGITGVRTTADNSGNLALQANGVTLLTVATNNTIVLGNTLKFADGSTANTAASGGGPGVFQAIQSANFTATANNIYAVNTAAATIYANLPASPSVGQYVTFIDFARTFGTNNLVINPNGSLVEGLSNTSTIGTNGAAVSAVYSGAVQGWLQYSSVSTPQLGGYAANYLVAAGGGGGANYNSGGGGGAGGLLTGTATLVPGVAYTVTIGAGGTGSTGSSYSQTNGANTSFIGSSASFTSIGGGAGGNNGGTTAPYAARNGGSGGGAGGESGGTGVVPGSGTTGQGNAGGYGVVPYTTGYPCGGGGGASQVGGTASSSGPTGGYGGNGTSSTISGTAVYYCGGGGGGTQVSGTGGAGGAGGGGNGGGSSVKDGVAGTANRGGGGGGGGYVSGPGTGDAGAGGSGIVILSYQGSQRGSGGTVSSAAGYTIHTFTSSGTYTA